MADDRRRRPGRGRVRLRGRARRAADRPPPVLRARARSRRARTRARRSTSSTRTTASPLVLEELDLDRHGDVDAAIVAYPHGASAPLVAELLRARGQGRRPERRLPAARPRDLRGVLRRAPAPRADRRGGLRAARAATAQQIARDRPRRRPRLLPDGGDPGAGAAGARGLIDDVVIDAKSGVSGAGRARDAEDALRDRRRERHALRRRHATATRRRSTRSWRARRDGSGDVHAAPAAARPGRAGVLLRRRTDAADVEDVVALYEEAYADEPFVELVDAPAGRARRARDEHLPHQRPGRPAHRQGAGLRRDRQPVEGHVVAGRAVAEPDVRPRRDGGAAVSRAPDATRSSARAGSTCPTASREVAGRPLPRRASAPPAPRRASSRPAASTSACSSATREETTSAARFTRSGTAAPPVLVTRERARLDALRAVAVNSGNANAATGRPGHGRGRADAGRRRDDGAGRPRTASRSARPASSASSSTAARPSAGCWRPARRCAPDGVDDFQQAIMTTDLFEKRATLEVDAARRRPCAWPRRPRARG